jgi:hypothetical protein
VGCSSNERAAFGWGYPHAPTEILAQVNAGVKWENILDTIRVAMNNPEAIEQAI